MNTRLIIALFVLSLCLGEEKTYCYSGYQSILFERRGAEATCQFLLSDLEQKEGLQLIADINEKPAYCVNPGYYMLKCTAPTTVKITIYKPAGGIQSTEDAVFDEKTLAYHITVENNQVENVTKDFDRSKPISGEEDYPKSPYTWREPIECNQKGYLKYLDFWGDAKCTPHNPKGDQYGTEADFQQRYEYFLDSCVKINDWNSRNKYQMEFTFYADWHPDEFEEITTTKQRYSGIHTPVPSTVPIYNNSNYRYLMPSVDPCDDDMGTIGLNKNNTGRRLYDMPIYTGDLASYICKPQNCSVSWAFAVTNSIEYAIKDLYIKEFDQIVRVSLSAQELIDCVPKEHDHEGKACEGMPIAWGFDWIVDNGISYRYFYPHTNKEESCKDIPHYQKYWIDGYEKPAVYNKLGLFEIVMKGPTAVTLGLDPEFFQYYRSDRRVGPYFDTAFWRPSVYGVVVEYYQYEPEGSENIAEWPFFAIETRLRACYSMVFRLPIRESTEDANIAGIAGFAIRPIVSSMVTKLIPTPEPTEPPTPTPTPTPEPWYAIYDPFILGDNSNYATAESTPSEVPSDIEVLGKYLETRDLFPTKALYHTRVLALSGMTVAAIDLFKESLSKQRMNPNPIDCYFFGDHLKPRYLQVDEVEPLMELTQYTRPSRLVISSGTIMREGMRDALRWMNQHKTAGYFVNLEYLEISRNKCANYKEGANGVALANEIVGYLRDMCSDLVNYPKLTEMKFNNNAYSEKNDGFDEDLEDACKQTSRSWITITAPENDRTKQMFFCSGNDIATNEDYPYYNITDEAEKIQCRFTWSWEFMHESADYSDGPWETSRA